MGQKPQDLIARFGVRRLVAMGVAVLLVLFIVTRPGLPRLLVVGVLQGSIVGMLALGIVLVNKGSRVFNFAQAEFGTAATFLVYGAFSGLGLPYGLAFILGLVGAGLIGFTMERLVVRPLFNAPRVTLLVATAGVALLLVGIERRLGGVRGFNFDPLIQGDAFTLFGEVISYQELIILLTLAGIAIALAYFFNKTDLGLAVLATSQESVATELVGIGTKRISSFVWTLAATLGGLAGVLWLGNSGTFNYGAMTFNFLLVAFTAAVIGGINSLWGALLGGQVVGILHAIGAYFDDKVLKEVLEINLSAFPELVIFMALLAILIFKPGGLLGAEA